MSAFDYKKEYKQLYQPKNKPELIQVPPMQFVAVEGKGNPNEENGAYADALALLYAISFTVKMSHLGSKKIEGYFPYVVPPLEGLWWMSNGEPGVDYSRKSEFCWISMIRFAGFCRSISFGLGEGRGLPKEKNGYFRSSVILLGRRALRAADAYRPV